MEKRDRLISLVRQHALEIKPEGEFFTLKSGAQSRYYLDCRNLNLTPNGLNTVVNCLWHQLGVDKLLFDAIGGPCVGADPIVGGMMFFMGLTSWADKYRGFLVRKAEKEHGKGGRIIGPLRKGDRCVIVEDVTTTGASALDAVEAVQEFGASVVHVYCIVDRLAGGAEAFAAKGIPFTPLLTIRDFGLE